MPSPVTPNEIKDTLPNVDSSLCDKLKKVIIDFPRKVYAWMSYMYNDDGTFSEDFKQEIMLADYMVHNKAPKTMKTILKSCQIQNSVSPAKDTLIIHHITS